MKTRSKIDIWRYGLMLALLSVVGIATLAGAAAPVPQIPYGPKDINGNWATPDYYTTANWANTPPLAKFVDTLPGLTIGNKNNLDQFLPLAVADTTTYPGSDYYIIELREYSEKMHSDLNPTKLRGYVQVNAAGQDVSPIHYLGPIILAERDRPVRLLFRNKLPLTANGGDLFIPVDTSVMGAGTGPADASGQPCDNTSLTNANGCASYTQNRADIHLHGGRTPWISDGTPHQWIIPAGEVTPFQKGVSLQNVPDMPDPGPGAATYYFTNQQSARLMFYHDHAFGITRLNVYAGEAAGYVIKDKHEQDLIDRGLIPPLLDQIPLIIQDKTFVDATPVTHPVTGNTVPRIRVTDPLWNWGSADPDPTTGIRPPVTGDLWLPHVYMPAQTSTAGAGGVNPFGRWMYGPWFYPATVVSIGPKANPYYDPFCSSSNPFELAECETPGQPVQIPGTPNVSMGMEAFQDTALVNGTAFPSLTVDPRAYRFRILNAASDRFQNLSFYVADGTAGNISPDPRLDPAHADYRAGRSNRTEVKMVPASAALAAAGNWPALWPTDGRDGGVPDPGAFNATTGRYENLGPSFLQIGTEGGFLPKPVVINPQPITYNTDPTAFWVGNVDKMGLALGPAERADVIVDFSAYAGQTLILYNDAPAAWPARVAGYDYFTGAPDMRDSGGFGAGGVYNPATGVYDGGHGPLPGYAPNTRTVMQVIVRAAAPSGAYSFNQAALEAEFTAAAPVVDTATYQNLAPTKTLFERSQEPIIVGQAAYADAYPDSYFPTNFPWEGISQINDSDFQFVTLTGQQVVIPQEYKGIHDEMGASFDPLYGRMSGNLAMQIPKPKTNNANLILYGYSDIPTETVADSTSLNVEVLSGAPGMPGTVKDGTQIWKISHNGVDTHPIHFHIFDVQLINRVGWDGQILMPEPNELGWKDTVKISPLEDTIVAVRPRAPALPFGIPNSLRPLNPAIPIDSTMGFTPPTNGSAWPEFRSIDPITGQAYPAGNPSFPYPNFKGVVTNVLYDFGWEYVWHCHILSHEEMDMMRPIVLQYTAELPPAFPATGAVINGNYVVTWEDPTPVTTIPVNPEDYRNAANEIGYNVYRTTAGEFPVDAFGTPTPLNGNLYLRANSTSFTDVGADGFESYVVEAFNAKGSTLAFVGTIFTVAVNATGQPFTSPGPVNLTTTINKPAGITVSQVAYYDGATLLGTATTAPYTFVWNSAPVGTHPIIAKASINIPGGVMVSGPTYVTVGGTGPLTADFTPAAGAIFNVCDPITFDASSSIGTITGYSWLINGMNALGQIVPPMTLPAGVYPITLAIANGAETAQVTKNITVINTPPVANAGGPYTITNGGSLTLNGSGTDVNGACDVLSYAWDLDNKNGYEYVIANPFVTFKALKAVLGLGVHTVSFKVTDSNGGVTITTTTITVSEVPPTVTITAPANGAAVLVGTNITINATATATAGTISKVEFFDGATLLNTDTATPFSYTWIGAAVGAHTLTAKATDSNGLVITSAGVGVNVVTPATGVTLTNDKVSPQIVNTPVVFTAAGTGGSGPYEYRFYDRINNGAFTLVQNYSTTPTWTLNTSVVGTHQIFVHVRVVGSTTDIESQRIVTYSITAAPPLPATGVTLTTDKVSPQIVNIPVVFTAAGSGGSGTYEYRFYDRVNNGGFTLVQNYSTTPTWTLNTSVVGTHQIIVHVRSVGSASNIESQRSITYTITAAPPLPATGATLTTDKASPQAVNTPVVFTAAGSGGSGTYEYRFYVRVNNGGFTLVQNYSTTPTWTLNTSVVGTHQVFVHVRSVGSITDIESQRNITYTITAAPPLPATGATLTTDKASPQAVNIPVVFTAAGSGGSGTYEYRFYDRVNNGGFTLVQNYSTTPTWTLNTSVVGTHQVFVHVRSVGSITDIESQRNITFVVQ